MKKGLFYYFLFITALSGLSNVWGMTPTAVRRTGKLRRLPTYTSKTIYQTKSYQPLTWTARLKLSYNRFKELLWGPGKPQKEVFEDIVTVAEKIKNEDPDSVLTLGMFIQQHSQEEVNILLNKLVFEEKLLRKLNGLVYGLWMEQEVNATADKTILKKITTWTKDNIMRLFTRLDIDNNFFLPTLLELSFDRDLIALLQQNFTDIYQTQAGKKFVALLQQEKKREALHEKKIKTYERLYRTIVPQTIRSILDAEKPLPTTRE